MMKASYEGGSGELAGEESGDEWKVMVKGGCCDCGG